MYRNAWRILTAFMLVALVTLSCSYFTGSSTATPTKSSSGGVTGTAAVPTKTTVPPTSTTAPKSDVTLGDVQKSDQGGFSYRAIPDYDLQSNFSIVSMIAAGADPVLGPMMMMIGAPAENGKTLEKLLEEVNSGNSAMTLSEARKVKVGGVDALEADFSGVDNGNNISGKIVVALPSATQQWTALGGAEKDTWKKEFAPIFDAVIASVAFFPPKDITLDPTRAPTTISATKSPTRTSTAAPTATPTESGPISQWASSAKASSQFGGGPGWAPSQANGKPNTTECSERLTAWASKATDTQEWLEVSFKTPVQPSLVNISQVNAPSQVVKVELVDVDGKYHQVYTAKPKDMGKECPYILAIPLTTNFLVKGVKISIDQSVLKKWNEIDAVELVGLPSGGGTTEPTPAAQSEFPMPKDATNIVKTSDTTIYQTRLTLKEMLDFNRTELAKQGLKEDPTYATILDNVFSLIFKGSPNGKDLAVQGIDMGNGMVNISLHYQDQ